jgi:glycosyltransferase involved in cell wall biosynthesis
MRSLGLPDDRVTLTPYVVDNDWWLVQSARVHCAAVRASWGAAAADLVVLFCAKRQPWKRPADLLQAFAKAKAPRGLLVFAGEGPLRAQLEREAAALGIAARVRFLGFVNQAQLPGVYTAADLMVLPSVYDAFGVVVNEVMLCGCPVVASDHVGAARDLIVQDQTGFVYPCGNIDALTEVLQQALTRPEQLAELGRTARGRMESWPPRENIQGTVKAISLALSRGRERRQPTPATPQTGTADSSRSAPQKLSE